MSGDTVQEIAYFYYVGYPGANGSCRFSGTNNGMFFEHRVAGVWVPDGYLSSPRHNVVTVVANYNVLGADSIVLCDATGGAFQVNLPAAADSEGQLLAVKKIDASANSVTIDANGAEEIDGELTQEILFQWTSLRMVCDGSDWFIV